MSLQVYLAAQRFAKLNQSETITPSVQEYDQGHLAVLNLDIEHAGVQDFDMMQLFVI